MKRVVVTGIGALTPIGNNVAEFWNNLLAGKSGAAPITRFDASAFKTRFACEVKNFEPTGMPWMMEKAEIRKLDLFTQYAFAAADECFKDAGYVLDDNTRLKTGVVWGSGMGGMITYEDGMFDYFQNNKVPRFSPLFITKIIPNITSGQLSMRYKLHGPSYATAAACTSSNNAIVDGFNFIKMGYIDAMLVGGSEAPICQGPIGGFNAMRALSELNDSPETASRPFDKTRSGFVLGEGAGAILIESLENALARGAKIYCELASCGLASDGHHVTAPHPEGLGAKIAMQQALQMAGLKPEDIDHINAHATATPLGDISECKAIAEVFNGCLDKIHISATKSMTGHLMGAAGAVEAIATILAIKNNIIPPSINQFERDLEIDSRLNLTPNKSREMQVNAAMNNTFGFGGHIVSSLFVKYF
jgi:3-oxoacyl-[acyl-carrier-protein] synthase II